METETVPFSLLGAGARRLALCLVLCLLALVVSGPASAQERVVVVSDTWMPYSGVPGSTHEGYAVEILRAVFERRGFAVDYQRLPRKRAVSDVRSGQADILIGVTLDEVPDFIFPKTSLGQSDLCFFSKDFRWRFNGRESLEGVVTGYIQGHDYPQWFMDDVKLHPERFHALHGEDATERLLAMLDEGRVQVIPGSRAVIGYYAQKADLQYRMVQAGCSHEDARDLYFGLTPANTPRSRLLADILDQGVHTLRNTGQLNHLLIKYGLKDWIKVRPEQGSLVYGPNPGR
ncbi:transporter substrate-binding domain-containing protein [uncultured Pseudodesulfovibrio sp.]|uniref:substrate-binding periplasmic protein n=1 Tax=uncultured Pseudodesulfovibrio sp. TaxID=2035858 RepID=UPI0029C8A4BA|nr:transporter substrate-binding domain-containing protein [uncultured Pseudodesulfovibrio sp.]